MKHVQAACIFQTLIFSQKDEFNYSQEEALNYNKAEVRKYKESLDKVHARYKVVEETKLNDGSIMLKIRKQYNDTTDVSEYFNL